MSTSTIPHPAAGSNPPFPAGGQAQLSRPQVLRLVRYLSIDGGCDRHVFADKDGLPDPQAANCFAQQMREQLGSFLNDLVTVERRGCQVVLRTVLPSYV